MIRSWNEQWRKPCDCSRDDRYPDRTHERLSQSGEGLRRPDLSIGDGIYKSTDGGKTWKNVGVRDGQQIGSILVDPRSPESLFVGTRPARLFRSADSGRGWVELRVGCCNRCRVGL